MAFSIFRLGRSSVSAAFERGALSGVASASVAVPEAPNKRPHPSSVSERCTGDSCPIDITRIRRNSATSTISERSLSTSAPASYAGFVRRYSKTGEPEPEDEKKKKKKKKEEEFSSDSDSDYEYHAKKGKGYERSKFWRRKMRTFHGILDVNKDGVIAYDDFQLLAKRFIDLGHLDKEQAEELTDIIRMTWEEQWGEISPYNLVTIEQYLTDMEHVVSDKSLRKRAGNFLPYLFKAVDKNHSGLISVNEFKLFFQCLGLSQEDAAVAFAAIDYNGDGHLSLKEFVKIGKDFFFTENESKVSKMFWGPLTD